MKWPEVPLIFLIGRAFPVLSQKKVSLEQERFAFGGKGRSEPAEVGAIGIFC